MDWAAVYAQMNKPAFVFDGRLLVDAEELRKIGFRVSLDHFVLVEFYGFSSIDCYTGPDDWPWRDV